MAQSQATCDLGAILILACLLNLNEVLFPTYFTPVRSAARLQMTMRNYPSFRLLKCRSTCFLLYYTIDYIQCLPLLASAPVYGCRPSKYIKYLIYKIRYSLSTHKYLPVISKIYIEDFVNKIGEQLRNIKIISKIFPPRPFSYRLPR